MGLASKKAQPWFAELIVGKRLTYAELNGKTGDPRPI